MAGSLICLGSGGWLIFYGGPLGSLAHSAGFVGMAAGLYWFSQAAAFRGNVRGVDRRAAKSRKAEAVAAGTMQPRRPRTTLLVAVASSRRLELCR